MSSTKPPAVGTIMWQDLTVESASSVRDFYQHVVGWTACGEEMGDYDDYHMRAPGTDTTVAGICHARGENADLPAVWMLYIVVADLDASVAECLRLGGEVVVPPRQMGRDLFAVIRDPAGAVCGLYQSG